MQPHHLRDIQRNQIYSSLSCLDRNEVSHFGKPINDNPNSTFASRRAMLQCPYTYVANVYCKFFYLFWTYVIANVLCCKCLMSRHGKGVQAKVVPSGKAVPACVREAKRARQQARSTKLYPWAWQLAQSTKLYSWVSRKREARSCIHSVLRVSLLKTGR
jgi:hypothetical protein